MPITFDKPTGAIVGDKKPVTQAAIPAPKVAVDAALGNFQDSNITYNGGWEYSGTTLYGGFGGTSELGPRNVNVTLPDANLGVEVVLSNNKRASEIKPVTRRLNVKN